MIVFLFICVNVNSYDSVPSQSELSSIWCYFFCKFSFIVLPDIIGADGFTEPGSPSNFIENIFT